MMRSIKDNLETLEILNLSGKYWETKEAIEELEKKIVLLIEAQKKRREEEE